MDGLGNMELRELLQRQVDEIEVCRMLLRPASSRGARPRARSTTRPTLSRPCSPCSQRREQWPWTPQSSRRSGQQERQPRANWSSSASTAPWAAPSGAPPPQPWATAAHEARMRQAPAAAQHATPKPRAPEYPASWSTAPRSSCASRWAAATLSSPQACWWSAMPPGGAQRPAALRRRRQPLD
jgi:hypothetical protein